MRAASSSPARSWITRCRAPTICPILSSLLHPVRCTTNPLGVKGVGEAGTTASLAAVMNAVADAGANIDMPATPERVWRALSAHGGGT
jgi:carbon-monoxide dehydrogenase large subunit